MVEEECIQSSCFGRYLDMGFIHQDSLIMLHNNHHASPRTSRTKGAFARPTHVLGWLCSMASSLRDQAEETLDYYGLSWQKVKPAVEHVGFLKFATHAAFYGQVCHQQV